MTTQTIGGQARTAETIPVDRAREVEAALQIGLKFGTELRIAHGPHAAGLPAAETLLAGADPDLLPVGRAFLDGVHAALAEGRCTP